MDAGIIRNFKLYFAQLSINHIIKTLEETKKIELLDINRDVKHWLLNLREKLDLLSFKRWVQNKIVQNQ